MLKSGGEDVEGEEKEANGMCIRSHDADAGAGAGGVVAPWLVAAAPLFMAAMKAGLEVWVKWNM